MGVVSAKKIEIISEQIARGKSPKDAILEAIGDLSKVKVFADLVLLGTFIRGDKTASGLFLPKEHIEEDEFQGKVGLVLKTGPHAYDHNLEEAHEAGENAHLQTWVVYAIKDSWPLQINGVACRLVPYEKLRMTVPYPEMVF